MYKEIFFQSMIFGAAYKIGIEIGNIAAGSMRKCAKRFGLVHDDYRRPTEI